MRSRAANILVAVLFAGCAKTIVVLPPADTVGPVPTTSRLYANDAPAFTESARLVVTDAASLNRVWQQATSQLETRPPVPAVDFTRETVLLVAAGPMKPGDQIRVDSVGVRGESFVVVVKTIEECQDFPTPTYPMELVRAPLMTLPVRWQNISVRAPSCATAEF